MDGDLQAEVSEINENSNSEDKNVETIEIAREPQGPMEVSTIEVINESISNFPGNPDMVFQTIANVQPMEIPRPEGVDLENPTETTEASKQESDAERMEVMKEEMCLLISKNLSKKDDNTTSEFVEKFNQESKGLLVGHELRVLKADGEKIVIVSEKGDLQELIVNSENAKAVLKDVKSVDKEIRGDSYALRREILHRSNGSVNTCEAYTYSVDLPKGEELDIYLDNPENWIPEIRELNKQIIENGFEKSKAMAERLGDEIPTTYTVRGNIASGKTTAMRNDPFFSRAIGPDGEPSGSIAPDVYKAAIRNAEATDGKQNVDHRQVHAHSSMISRAITSRLLNENSSIVIDKMMHEQSSIEKLVATVTIENGREIKMLDLDVPLEASCLRVLGRQKDGVDPLIPFDSIAEGYKKIRGNRMVLIDKVVKNNPSIKEYTLLVTDDTGTPQKVLVKTNEQISFIKGGEALFEKAITPVMDSEVLGVANTMIDDVYISKILQNTVESRRAKVQGSLERYKGYTIKQALDLHSGQIK